MTQAKIDAAVLAGFILGTYDLKGEDKPPAMILPFIERAMKFPPFTAFNTDPDVAAGMTQEEINSYLRVPNKKDDDKKPKKLNTSGEHDQVLDLSIGPIDLNTGPIDIEPLGDTKPLGALEQFDELKAAAGAATELDKRYAAIEPKKERKPWSEEARAAARERAIARGLGTKVKKGDVGIKLDPPADDTRRPDADYEIDEGKVLTREAHWPDIKRMNDNGLPLLRIAKDQRVELPYLAKFIEKMQAEDERGN